MADRNHVVSTLIITGGGEARRWNTGHLHMWGLLFWRPCIIQITHNSRQIMTKDGSFFCLPTKVALLCDQSVRTVYGLPIQPILKLNDKWQHFKLEGEIWIIWNFDHNVRFLKHFHFYFAEPSVAQLAGFPRNQVRLLYVFCKVS